MKIRTTAKQAYAAFVDWSNNPESYKQVQHALYVLSGQDAADKLCAAIDESVAGIQSRGYIKVGLVVAALWPKPPMFRTISPVAMLSIARRGLRDLGIITSPQETHHAHDA